MNALNSSLSVKLEAPYSSFTCQCAAEPHSRFKVQKAGIKGRTGSGKSTIARLSTGLLKPTSGQIMLRGTSTAAWGSRAWQRQRGIIQLLFQDPLVMLNPTRTLRANLNETVRIHRSTLSLDYMAEALQIKSLLDELPNHFSGGELRRSSLARVLLAQPQILVADEPAVGLDLHLKADILQVLLQHLPESCSVLLISHDDSVHRFCVDEVMELKPCG